MLLQVFQGPCPSFVCRMKRQENMGSARNVARYITRGRVTRVVIIFVGIAAAVGDAPITVIDHVTFICDDHHRVILKGEGPDQRVHVVFNPTRQVTPDGRGYGAMAASKSKLGWHSEGG